MGVCAVGADERKIFGERKTKSHEGVHFGAHESLKLARNIPLLFVIIKDRTWSLSTDNISQIYNALTSF